MFYWPCQIFHRFHRILQESAPIRDKLHPGWKWVPKTSPNIRILFESRTNPVHLSVLHWWTFLFFLPHIFHPHVHGRNPLSQRKAAVRSILSQYSRVLLQPQISVRGSSYSIHTDRRLLIHNNFPWVYQVRFEILFPAVLAIYVEGDFLDFVSLFSLFRAGIYACLNLHDSRSV